MKWMGRESEMEVKGAMERCDWSSVGVSESGFSNS